MKKEDLPITEISLEDFYKLNLTAYELRVHHFNKSDQRVPDDKVFVNVPAQVVDGVAVNAHFAKSKDVAYSKLVWDEVNLNDRVRAEVEASLDDSNGVLVDCRLLVAIHDEPTADDFNAFYEQAKTKLDPYTGKQYTESQALEVAKRDARYVYSYLDKYLTPLGSQTYLFSNYITKLYSIRDYYEERNLGIRIPKKGTKAIYLIKYR